MGDENVPKLDSIDAQLFKYTKKPLNCTFLTGKLYGIWIIAQLKKFLIQSFYYILHILFYLYYIIFYIFYKYIYIYFIYIIFYILYCYILLLWDAVPLNEKQR